MITTEQIIEAFEDAGCEVRAYSGRGMYGKACIGVDTENPIDTVIDVLESFAENASDQASVAEFAGMLRGARTDSMGRAQIVYWPDLEMAS